MDMKLDGRLLKLMLSSAANNLINHKKYLNDLNVFPVPDGDTGTNMGKTFQSANAAAQAVASDSVSEVLDAMATASLRGARGNSGVILSQILRGYARAANVNRVTKEAAPTNESKLENRNMFAIMRCMKFGAETAYRAVMKPTEGTILTVAREMAEFAEANYSKFKSATKYFAAILQAGRESLARTPELLPMLKQANVVDAGGAGLILLIEGAVHLLTHGEEIPLRDEVERTVAPQIAAKMDIDIKYVYCTEFIIVKSGDSATSAAQFQTLIEPKGDSLVVIEDDDIVKVHIHTNNPGAVMEEGLKLGELSDIKIDNMRYQHAEAADGLPANIELKEHGFVAVSTGDGIEQMFRDMGVDIVVAGGQTMNPSTQDILDAVESVPAKAVYILPNNKNIVLAAEQVVELTEKAVAVIPTKSIPEGIAAMFAFDGDGEIDANKENMTEAAAMVKSGYVTYAARDSEIDGLSIKQNDIMGLDGGKVKVVGDSPTDICRQVVEILSDDDTASISLYYGEDVDEAEAEALQAQLEEAYSLCDVMVYRGGQPLYYYIISVE
ncbi:MAG: DAK2 domain-containing protein [Oscillospiraceae bacterium]|nr:DAK2 domain-containing protein [Oscillospiraceae bacterium]